MAGPYTTWGAALRGSLPLRMDDGGGLAGVVKEGSKPNQTKPNISYHGSGHHHHHLAIVLAVSIAHVLCAQSKIHSYFFFSDTLSITSEVSP